MIDRDFINEVWDTILKKRFRSLMTAFRVFWGMFILVLLIGAGVGLQNGLYASYNTMPANSVVIIPRPTMLSYGGFEAGRTWNLTISDMEKISKFYSPQIKNMAMLNLANNGNPVPVRVGNLVSNFELAGEEPLTFVAVAQKVLKGRFVNELDMAQKRNVCVIGNNVAEKMFGDEMPVGKQIMINDNVFTVIGVGKNSGGRIDIGFDISEGIVIPLNLMQLSYNQGDAVHRSYLILNDGVDANEFIEELDTFIRRLHNLHPDDTKALRVVSREAWLSKIKAIFDGFNFLIWIVGIGTLLASLIGVSNVMMITVKERTKEIGIRTAMGASPYSIVGQIMCESLVISFFSGVLGICLGVGTLALISKFVATENMIFEHPYLPFKTGIYSLLILVAGGILSGIIPTVKALKINLVKALSDK